MKPTKLASAEYKDKSPPPARVTHRSWNLRYVATVTLLWLALVHYYERHYVSRILSKCQWSKWESWRPEASVHRILLVADPQIVDDYSYPGQPRILNYFVKQITDNYLRRNYAATHRILTPNTTIFLGDLFDGGREWNDSDWKAEYLRYRAIFPPMDQYYSPENPHTVFDSIPGNHDIGFEEISSSVRERFSNHFGPLNRVLNIGGHHIVMIDTISYSHTDENISKESHEFMASLPTVLGSSNQPRILMSHVPLYRDPKEKLCGPDREKPGLFPYMKGKQYQTIIEHKFSFEILEAVNPVLIFAGDDHDYCDIRQEFQSHGADRTAREITAKAAGMSGGIKRPAVQLLSLHNSQNTELDSATFETRMCYMPDPLITFKVAGIALSILFLVHVLIARKRENSNKKMKLRWVIMRQAQALVIFCIVLTLYYATA